MNRSITYNVDALDIERIGTIIDKKSNQLFNAVRELIIETLDKGRVSYEEICAYVDEEDDQEVEVPALSIRELDKDGIRFHVVVDESGDTPFIVDFYPVLPAMQRCAPLHCDCDVEEIHNVATGLVKMGIGSERVFFHIEDYPLFRAIQKEEDSAELTVDVVGNFSSCRKVTSGSEEEGASVGRLENAFLSGLSCRQDSRSWNVIGSKVFDVESVIVMGIPMYRMRLQLGTLDVLEGAESNCITVYAKQSFFTTPVEVGDFVVGKAWLQGRVKW